MIGVSVVLDIKSRGVVMDVSDKSGGCYRERGRVLRAEGIIQGIVLIGIC